MNSLLKSYLESLGIKNISELSSTERETYDQWESILSKGKTKIKDIEDFCEQGRKIIEKKLLKANNEELRSITAAYKVLGDILHLVRYNPKEEKEKLKSKIKNFARSKKV